MGKEALRDLVVGGTAGLARRWFFEVCLPEEYLKRFVIVLVSSWRLSLLWISIQERARGQFLATPDEDLRRSKRRSEGGDYQYHSASGRYRVPRNCPLRSHPPLFLV